jgi:hypothetical protein
MSEGELLTSQYLMYYQRNNQYLLYCQRYYV